MKKDIIYKEEVYRIIGCALEVHRALGPGLLEKPYENALVQELGFQGVSCISQLKFPVIYKSNVVAEYIADLLVEDTIIIEIKSVETITDIHRAQLINYLKITGKKLGLLINFNCISLQWERIVNTGNG